MSCLKHLHPTQCLTSRGAACAAMLCRRNDPPVCHAPFCKTSIMSSLARASVVPPAPAPPLSVQTSA